MKITSPLGILAMAGMIYQYNLSKDAGLKEKIRKSVMEAGTSEERRQAVLQSFKDLSVSQLSRVMLVAEPESKFEFGFNIAATLLSQAQQGKKGWNMFDQSLVDKAYDEVAYYLRRSFEMGCLEQLPVQEFGYDPDPDLVVERRIIDGAGRMQVKGPSRFKDK